MPRHWAPTCAGSTMWNWPPFAMQPTLNPLLRTLPGPFTLPDLLLGPLHL